MSCNRKFRELKTADEEKALLENLFQNQHDMSQSSLFINIYIINIYCLHIHPHTPLRL